MCGVSGFAKEEKENDRSAEIGFTNRSTHKPDHGKKIIPPTAYFFYVLKIRMD